MKLTVQPGFLDDWWLIERAEHDGRSWLERTGSHSSALRCSSRFSDADVEGSGFEMLEIARAIKGRRDQYFKRCAVSFQGDGVHFRSPRNSQKDGVVTIAEADALADEILATVKLPDPETTEGSP